MGNENEPGLVNPRGVTAAVEDVAGARRAEGKFVADAPGYGTLQVEMSVYQQEDGSITVSQLQHYVGQTPTVNDSRQMLVTPQGLISDGVTILHDPKLAEGIIRDISRKMEGGLTPVEMRDIGNISPAGPNSTAVTGPAASHDR